MKNAGIVVALCALGVAFGVLLQLIYWQELEQGVLLFCTLPALVGMLSAMLPLQLHPIGKALLAVTFCLLESFVVFREGVICVLMAAPLFYGFAIIGALAYDFAGHARRGQRAIVFAGLPLVTLLLGPVQPHPVVEVEARVRLEAVTVAEVRDRIAAPRTIDAQPLHWALGLFPRPEQMDGSGLEVGDQRAVWMGGGEGQPGWFVTEIVESGADGVVFETVADRSHIAHWLDWKRDTLTWTEVPGGVEVSWRAAYRSELAPDWYFGPVERWAAQTVVADLLAARVAPVR